MFENFVFLSLFFIPKCLKQLDTEPLSMDINIIFLKTFIANLIQSCIMQFFIHFSRFVSMHWNVKLKVISRKN